MELREYSIRIDDFQIRAPVYLGKSPKDEIKFDIVKWEKIEPTEVIEYPSWKRKVITEHCYSVASLVWNHHEGVFDFDGVGLRWLEANPSKRVIDMILDFAKKYEELYYETDGKNTSMEYVNKYCCKQGQN